MASIERPKHFVPARYQTPPGVPTSPLATDRDSPRVPADALEKKRSHGPFEAQAGAATGGATSDRLDHDLLVAALASVPAETARLRAARPRWKETAPALVAASSSRVGAHLEAVAMSFGRAREALWSHPERNARVRYGVAQAEMSLERIASGLGAAHEITSRRLVPAGMDSLPSALAAHLAEIRTEAEAAGRELGEVVAWAEAPGIRIALDETESLRTRARAAEQELQLLGGRTAMLAEGEAASASEGATASSTLGAEDLARLGSAFDAAHPPAQVVWNATMTNLVAAEGRGQGGLAEDQAARNRALAGETLPPGALASGALDIAALVVKSGVPPERVDPNQVVAASRFVAAAATPTEAQERLAKVLDVFHVLDRIGLPRLPPETLRAQLDAAAKIPRSATKKLGEAELRAKFTEVAATLNAGGELRTKVGGYKVTLKVDENGRVTQASAKKPGFFSRVGSALKAIVPVALTVLSFVPATAVFARLAQGAISLVNGIKNHSVLGIAAAGASLVGAGAAAAARTVARGASSVLGRVESLANSAGRALQGVSSLRQRSFVAGIASIGGAVADGIKSFTGSLRSGLDHFADRMGKVSARLTTAATGISAVDAYRAAERTLAAAREALTRARASGNPELVAAAERRVDEAERGKRAALLGGGAAAFGMAADVAGDRRPRPAGDRNFPPPRSSVEAQLRAASRGLSVARDVTGRDFVGAGVNALGTAAALQATGRDFDRAAFHPLNGAANVADAALSYRQTHRAEETTREAARRAEAALAAALRSGDPAAVAAARQALAEARRVADGTLVDAIRAGDALLQTAASVRAQRDVARERVRGETTRRDAREVTILLLSALEDPDASADERRRAVDALQLLTAAGERYDHALESGRVEIVRAARDALDAVRRALGVVAPPPLRVADGLVGFPRETPAPDASPAPLAPRKVPAVSTSASADAGIHDALLRLLDSTATIGPQSGSGPLYEAEIRQLLAYLEKIERSRRSR